MERAVHVMRSSEAEERTDGKVTPKVGAVLVKPDGTFTTAYRSELRDGDHAEFTLLERKHRDEKLNDCVLFATLEPCAPNARKAPKLGCAERIVLARIKRVWVGIEDPDPTVARKGIKHLQDHGVDVQMFDLDLQEQIQEENHEFLEQAKQRADEAEKQQQEVLLSPLETRSEAEFQDLSIDALRQFAERAGIPAPETPEFTRRLARMKLFDTSKEPPVPTGFGLLLFGEKPRITHHHAGLLGTIHYPNGKEEIEDFDGPTVFIPGQAVKWLRDKLPNVIDRSHAERRTPDDDLFEIVREGIVNALVHRDYDIHQAKCQLMVTPDTIEVWSPGKPVLPVTLRKLQSFDASMLSRNPVMHFAFSQMKLAEERGLGLKAMRERARNAGLPLPTYTWNDPYLILRVLRTPEAALNTLPPEILNELSESEREGWVWLSIRGQAHPQEYAQQMNIVERVARRHLNHFFDLGLVKTIGAGRTIAFEVTTDRFHTDSDAYFDAILESRDKVGFYMSSDKGDLPLRIAQRGRPGTYDARKDQRVYDDWKASGLSGKIFCRDRNISYQDFLRLCDRTRARNRMAAP